MITLALQGGGSHGAFTWGVLDRLLEDERLPIEAISGASAGAMNAIVLAQGYMDAGRDGARQSLKDFWNKLATKHSFAAGLTGGSGMATFGTTSDADIAELSALPPGFKSVLSMLRYFSPQQINPFDLNPLREILNSQIDFERIRSNSKISLFIAATHVNSGRLKLFRNAQLNVEVLMASACLPLINRAVEIDGEAYWDGGLSANPPLLPLVYQCQAKNLLVVLLQAEAEPKQQAPSSADDIWHRLSEMGFSSCYLTEMDGLLAAKQQAQAAYFAFGRLERRLRALQIHHIELPEVMSRLAPQSKMYAEEKFLQSMHQAGRNQAELWIKQHFNADKS
ncbi:patatin-like phospholipase family protein [Undibacterium sp. Ren11W]|uniref:patatin-like phospholipase family protein n=1 Tax=Undibacterium sp. Ren11W TaxID=3413045 RepID=UPI003BF463AA